MKYILIIMRSLVFKQGILGSLIVPVLIGGIGLCAGIYIFLIAQTTFHIAERKNIKNEIRTQESILAEQEINYFELAHAITYQTIQEYGYSEFKNPSFVSLDNQSTVALSTR